MFGFISELILLFMYMLHSKISLIRKSSSKESMNFLNLF